MIGDKYFKIKLPFPEGKTHFKLMFLSPIKILCKGDEKNMKGFTPLAWAAIGVTVGAIVIGAVAIPIFFDITTTDFSSTDYTIWKYIPTFMILSLLIGSIAAGFVTSKT